MLREWNSQSAGWFVLLSCMPSEQPLACKGHWSSPKQSDVCWLLSLTCYNPNLNLTSDQTEGWPLDDGSPVWWVLWRQGSQACFPNLVYQPMHVKCIERWFQSSQFIHNTSKAPHIRWKSIPLLWQELRGHVVRCPHYRIIWISRFPIAYRS